MQCAAHGDAAFVCDTDQVSTGYFHFIELVTCKKTYLDASTAGGEGFLAAQRIVDGFTGILFCPYPGNARGPPELVARKVKVSFTINLLDHVGHRKFNQGAVEKACRN